MDFVFALEHHFLLLRFRGFDRVADDALGLLFRSTDRVLSNFLSMVHTRKESDCTARGGSQNGNENTQPNGKLWHWAPPLLGFYFIFKNQIADRVR